MVSLESLSTKDLINEIKIREGTRVVEVSKHEVHKVQAWGEDDSKNRYIKGHGPAIIIEIKD